MRKTFIALAAVATIAGAAASPANAGSKSGAVAVGVLGGLAAGAIIGSAIAPAPAYAYPRTYAPVVGYEPYPVYARPAPYGCPGGYWARRPMRDQWGNVVGWSRPRYFCGR